MNVVCIQRAKLLNSETSVLSDVIDQCRGIKRGRPYDLHPKQIPYENSHPQASNLGTMEILTIEIPAPCSQMFTVFNWYLPLENSHYLQRTGILLSELQPDTKVHEVICTDVNAHDTIWDQTANPNAFQSYDPQASTPTGWTYDQNVIKVSSTTWPITDDCNFELLPPSKVIVELLRFSTMLPIISYQSTGM